MYPEILYPLISLGSTKIKFWYCCYRVVKATSPYLNILIIIGVIIIYGDVIVYGIDGRVASDTVLKITCNVCNTWCLYGCVVVY